MSLIDPSVLLDAQVGDRIWFEGEVKPYRVRAKRDHFLVCTKPFNPRHTVLYCIVDPIRGIRGPENFIFGRGAETDRECYRMARRVAKGESDISRRREAPLVVTRFEPRKTRTHITTGGGRQ